ncbi:SRPBCC family protein [Tenacibaculum singaporense]|uniref:SRPBCC family protein n=1 Tax=Tenacibaculum singaporense TaxID=2358479 RepID=UPI00142E7A48|nr:SRPBCC domain-containing protein [Tenacibaculum singaporense]
MKPIVVTKVINTSIDKVWEAITTHSLMLEWFFDNIPAFEPIVGFTTEFNVQSEERNFLHVWKVVSVVEKEKIVCEWKYPEYVDESLLVTFEVKYLSEEKTQFSVIALGIEHFSNTNISQFTRESCKGGWEYFSNQLQQFLL